MTELICLGIESSAHTFSIGIMTDKGNVLANEKSVYVPKRGEGIVPKEASELHTQNTMKILNLALKKAKIQMKDIDIVSATIGAGMPPCLYVGTNLARRLSIEHKKPFVGANHQVGHIEIGKLTTGVKDPVVLYLSGGNTQVIAFTEGRYRVFGETQDIPIGNAIDSLARQLNIPYPYGLNFDRTAEKGKKYVELPYVVKGMDLSFSGILTVAVKKFKEGEKKEDICYSFQETCFAMLTEVTERALSHTGKREVLLVGGVAASKRLQEMVKKMCEERGAEMHVVPREYSGDCGAMIAWVGLLCYKSGQKTDVKKDEIKPYWRTDEVDIPWLK